MEPYKKLQLARAKDRPTGKMFLQGMLTEFIELHGDRRFADDPAIVAGIGRLNGMVVTAIAHEKGGDISDKVRRNFGMAHPEGYRKALRLMKQAEKFHRPILCLVDTSGAFCGLGAEERGQGQAIAENLMEMMSLKTPVITVLIGEGGSGGALALAVANQVWMLENTVYSVISPEGCASILWKDSTRVREACNCLKITPEDLLSMGIIEEIIPEPEDFEDLYGELKLKLFDTFNELNRYSGQELSEQRYCRFRGMGVFGE